MNIKNALKFLCSASKTALKLAESSIRGITLAALCGALVLACANLATMLPSKGVSSIQLDEPMDLLVKSPVYDYKLSIVRLYANGKFFCSGVVIGANYLLTASHCVVDENGVMKKEVVKVVSVNNTVITEGRPAGVNTRMDWAIIHGDFSKIPGAYVVEGEFEAPAHGVVACGYPQGSATLNCSLLIPVTNDALLVKCRGGMIWPGQSGGPVFDKDGNLVGLNIQVYSAAEGGGTAYSPTIGILSNFKVADF